MAGISLYPPIFLKAYMPAFDTAAPENATSDPDENGGCRVYFSLSAYNNLSQLARKDPNNYGDFVQVSVQGQSTNYTALNI